MGRWGGGVIHRVLEQHLGTCHWATGRDTRGKQVLEAQCWERGHPHPDYPWPKPHHEYGICTKGAGVNPLLSSAPPSMHQVHGCCWLIHPPCARVLLTHPPAPSHMQSIMCTCAKPPTIMPTRCTSGGRSVTLTMCTQRTVCTCVNPPARHTRALPTTRPARLWVTHQVHVGRQVVLQAAAHVGRLRAWRGTGGRQTKKCAVRERRARVEWGRLERIPSAYHEPLSPSSKRQGKAVQGVRQLPTNASAAETGLEPRWPTYLSDFACSIILHRPRTASATQGPSTPSPAVV